MTSRSWVGSLAPRGRAIAGGGPSRAPPGVSLAPLVCMAFFRVWSPCAAPAGRGKKSPSGSGAGGEVFDLIYDQSPRDARSDETMTAEEAATARKGAGAGWLI